MVDAFFYPVTNGAHRTMKMLINDCNLFYRTLEKHGCWYRLHKFLSVRSISGLLSQDRQQSPLCRFRTCDFTDRVESIRVFRHRGNYIVQRRGSNKLTFYKRKTRCNNETICTLPLKDCLRVRGNVTLQFEGRKKATVNI